MTGGRQRTSNVEGTDVRRDGKSSFAGRKKREVCFQISNQLLVRIQPKSLNGSETERGVEKVKTEERMSTKDGEVLTVSSVLPSSGQPQCCCRLFFFLSHKGPPELQLEGFSKGSSSS